MAGSYVGPKCVLKYWSIKGLITPVLRDLCCTCEELSDENFRKVELERISLLDFSLVLGHLNNLFYDIRTADLKMFPYFK